MEVAIAVFLGLFNVAICAISYFRISEDYKQSKGH